MLQKTISAIRPETWEQINQTLLSGARQAKIEDGAIVRLDSTVTSALMHEPSDSSLLWDAVRVMVRLLKRADTLVGGAGSSWRDHCRAAKKRARQIQFTRGRPNRVQLYRELIAITRATLAYLEQASERLAGASTPLIAQWQAHVRHYRPLIERIIRQSQRRVLAGEQVTPGAPWRIVLTGEIRQRLCGGEAPAGWVGLSEAARRLGLSKSHVAYLVKTGKLKAVQTTVGKRRCWRIDVDSADCGTIQLHY